MAYLTNFIIFLLSLLIHRFSLFPILIIPWYNNPLGLMLNNLHYYRLFELVDGP